jgi:hypothetical protein
MLPRFASHCAVLAVSLSLSSFAYAGQPGSLDPNALQVRIAEQHLPCDTVIAASTEDADAAYVVTCDVAETRDTHLPGRVAYAMGPAGEVLTGRRVVNGTGVINQKSPEVPRVYAFSACGGDSFTPEVCDATAKVLQTHLTGTGHACTKLTKLMQLGSLQFTVAVCSNLPSGMMYEVRPTEVKLVDYNTMRVDLLYAERDQ